MNDRMKEYWEKRKLEFDLDELVNAVIITAKALVEHGVSVDEINEGIERQYAISTMMCGMSDIPKGQTIQFIGLPQKDELKYEIPSADVVERKRGEWIKTDRTYCGATVYECSACCYEVDEMPTVMGEPRYNYCPSCGAYMRGSENG